MLLAFDAIAQVSRRCWKILNGSFVSTTFYKSTLWFEAVVPVSDS